MQTSRSSREVHLMSRPKGEPQPGDGDENAPAAFIGLKRGENFAKMRARRRLSGGDGIVRTR